LKRYAIEIAPGAEADIRDALLWYLERNALIAEAFRIEVFRLIDSLARNALSGAVDSQGDRRRVLKRFPYTVFYEMLGETVTILAVAHHRRRPDYWRNKGH
jgi:toxin ParE1/3/4